MASLRINDAGITLDNSAQSSKSLSNLAFGTVLDGDVIENMIQCVQNGESIDLVFGPEPYFEIGSKRERHEFDIQPESVDCDLYLTTNPTDPAPKTLKFPNPTRSLFEKPPAPEKPAKAKRGEKAAARNATTKGAKGAKGTTKAAATKAAATKASKAASILPPGKSAMSQAMSGAASRSLPPSPGLTTAASPNNNPAASATQQLFEKNKEQRSALVHELAAKDQTYEELADTWTGPEAEMKPTLEKVASIVDQANKTWSLKKLYWKELDVWNYPYSKPEDRLKAIDNAIKQYDRQRMGTASPEWERLLAPEERGKGIILSKLQATLAKGNINPAPKPASSKTEEATKSDSEPPKPKSAPMSRNSSQSTTAPKPAAKKAAEAPKRSAPSAAPKKTVSAPKKPVAKVKAAEEKGGRGPLSEEFVVDSDSSGDEAVSVEAPKPKAAEKPSARPVDKAADKPAARPAEKVADKPTEKRKVSPSSAPATKPKPVVRAPRAPTKASQPAPQKRSRDDDDSSSSSGAPLSKRLKPKELPKAASSSAKARDPADQPATQKRPAAAAAPSGKSKNTSPVKSSPLASSPPTNASDIEEKAPLKNRLKQQRPAGEREQGRNGDHVRNADRPNGVANGASPPPKKRKERAPERAEPVKKPRISDSLLELSQRFQSRYNKYEVLHLEVVALERPPQAKVDDLLKMRNHLAKMKERISREVAMATAA